MKPILAVLEDYSDAIISALIMLAVAIALIWAFWPDPEYDKRHAKYEAEHKEFVLGARISEFIYQTSVAHKSYMSGEITEQQYKDYWDSMVKAYPDVIEECKKNPHRMILVEED
jgi:hypothetical protein